MIYFALSQLQLQEHSLADVLHTNKYKTWCSNSLVSPQTMFVNFQELVPPTAPSHAHSLRHSTPHDKANQALRQAHA